MSNGILKNLVKLGRSQYVCLSAPYLRAMGIGKNGAVVLSFRRGKIIIEPVRRSRAKKPRRKT